ncbi:MAG: hypothetical protein ACYSUY_19455 [Planctomycetota bacterium]|jgi:hypothetical protein
MFMVVGHSLGGCGIIGRLVNPDGSLESSPFELCGHEGNCRLVQIDLIYDIYGRFVRFAQCRDPIVGDIDLDCKVDFFDFAIMASRRLNCNLDPPEACWE